MSSRERSKEPSKESSKERRKAIPKGKKPKASEATSSSSAAATVSPTEAHVASSANIKSVLSKNLEAYEDVREEDLNAVLAAFANMDILPSSSSAAASVRPIKTFEEAAKSLAKTSEEVVSLSAAATRSPSPEHFAKITASLAASTAIAADLTLISKVKAQLSSEYDVAKDILRDVFDIPWKLRCQMITQFLSDIHAEVVKRSSESKKYAGGTTAKLLNLIDASKKTSCAHHPTDKDFLVYLISVMKTLFDKDFFNKDTLDTTGMTSTKALENRYQFLWNRVMNSTMGKTYVKRGGRRSKRRLRHNRTRKI